MNAKKIHALGIPPGHMTQMTQELLREAKSQGLSMSKSALKRELQALVDAPSEHLTHPHFGRLAEAMAALQQDTFQEREAPAPWQQWGDDLDPHAISQMQRACRLPVAVAGALMPDAHRGYGLPIGGVLATEEAIIPYAVGVDIACRMRLTVCDLPLQSLETDEQHLIDVLQEETRFGIGASFRKPRDHEVMDLDWNVSPVTKRMKNKARNQLGSSGSGNHFVEFGSLTLDEPDLGLAAGTYLALLSHSGSRGAGASVADHYSRMAMSFHPELPKELRHLAWLDMDHETGQEYWAAMNLMGDYAAANHAVIHREIVRALGVDVLAEVENHHNFAWRETHDGRDLYVHRKGATPAGKGVLGIIPGSMASPGYVVRGKGLDASLHSAAHGAGRVMSRKQAKTTLKWSDAKQTLKDNKVTLLSAGLDELPFVYKDIDMVMQHQSDLVETVARFDPRIVKMAPAGEPPED